MTDELTLRHAANMLELACRHDMDAMAREQVMDARRSLTKVIDAVESGSLVSERVVAPASGCSDATSEAVPSEERPPRVEPEAWCWPRFSLADGTLADPQRFDTTGDVDLLQEGVGQWNDGRRNGRRPDPLADGLAVAEEAGEVARAVLKRWHCQRPGDWSAEVRLEAADLVITVLSLAHNEGWSLWDAVVERWRQVEDRDDSLRKPSISGVEEAPK